MNTQTHLLVAAALFAKPDQPKRNTAALIGGFLPDLAISIFFVWGVATGVPQSVMWRDLYFQEPMLTFTAIANSAPLYLAITILALAWVKAKGGDQIKPLPAMAVVGLAALSHIAGDLPVHVDDAHPHFWPLSDWRFVSPVSYWDSNHFGREFTTFETLLGLALSYVVFRRFKALWVRALVATCVIAYVAVPIFWWLQFGG